MKINKRIGKLILKCLLCASMSLITLTILAEEPSQVTATCSDGTTVQCDGYHCTAQNNVGCSCKNKKGIVTVREVCPNE
jgi:hypothetical protein